MFISIDLAAEQLGLSRSSVMNLVAAGHLRRRQTTGSADVHAGDVSRVEIQRRHEATVRAGDLIASARTVVDYLRPIQTADGRKGGRDAIRLLSADQRAVWGLPALRAAAMPERSGVCRTCWARMSVDVYGYGATPQPTAAWRLLLGDPCPKDAAVWAAERSARSAGTARRDADYKRVQSGVSRMKRELAASQGARMVAEGQRLIASASPQTGRPVRLDQASLTASADALADAQRRRIDERIVVAVRRGDHAHARQLRVMRKAL